MRRIIRAGFSLLRQQHGSVGIFDFFLETLFTVYEKQSLFTPAFSLPRQQHGSVSILDFFLETLFTVYEKQSLFTLAFCPSVIFCYCKVYLPYEHPGLYVVFICMNAKDISDSSKLLRTTTILHLDPVCLIKVTLHIKSGSKGV